VGDFASHAAHTLRKSLMPVILFVCTANQFRSPIAAAYFTRKLTSIDANGIWTISSAGTWTPTGLPAHPQAVKAAAKLGLDLSAHRTREVNAGLLASADMIVVMEQGQKEAIEAEFPEARSKLVLLGSLGNIPGGEIPDPVRSDFAQPDIVARTICRCIDKGFTKLVQSSSI
jgi:protein-tyrosine-phosphatase